MKCAVDLKTDVLVLVCQVFVKHLSDNLTEHNRRNTCINNNMIGWCVCWFILALLGHTKRSKLLLLSFYVKSKSLREALYFFFHFFYCSSCFPFNKTLSTKTRHTTKHTQQLFTWEVNKWHNPGGGGSVLQYTNVVQVHSSPFNRVEERSGPI